MNCTALHCLDINYSGFTKPNRNKSILLKKLKGKQINRKPMITVLRKQNLYAIMFKPSMCIVHTVSCRSHDNIHHAINLLTRAQETHFSIKLSLLSFLICWYPALKSRVILNRETWWNSSELPKDNSPSSLMFRVGCTTFVSKTKRMKKSKWNGHSLPRRSRTYKLALLWLTYGEGGNNLENILN